MVSLPIFFADSKSVFCYFLARKVPDIFLNEFSRKTQKLPPFRSPPQARGGLAAIATKFYLKLRGFFLRMCYILKIF
jgi:hypothetical protein